VNKSDVAKILTIASAVDNRTVAPETVNAWFELIGYLSVDVALEAVRMHQRDSQDYLMPIHVRRNAARVISERERKVRREELDRLYVASIEARKIEPPKCRHGLTIAVCLPCSIELAAGDLVLRDVIIQWRDEEEELQRTVAIGTYEDGSPEDDEIFFYFANEEEYREAILNGTEDFSMREDME
jgi:hypothetical protein